MCVGLTPRYCLTIYWQPIQVLPFPPVLVGPVCHDDELSVKVNSQAVTVLSACLFVDLVATDWPYCTNLVNKEASILLSVGAAPLEFLHS